MFSSLFQELVDVLGYLKGVGPKTAQRMALQLLERDREKGLKLAKILTKAITDIQHCEQCHTLSETPVCRICANPKRDANLLCVVETPADILAIEQAQSFRGYYFVLMGHLSPLDGIGPKELGIDQLLQRLRNSAIEELILATNPTVEGEATACYITEQLQPTTIRLTRIAHGVPLGSELEYLDGGTLARALLTRTVLQAPSHCKS